LGTWSFRSWSSLRLGQVRLGASLLGAVHYAKRQFTWARHPFSGFQWVAPEEAVHKGAKALG
jgi:tRNA A37 N6-isopentenylltransferase MiaA